MTLVFDRRDELAGKPGTHALIVGVSSYPYLVQEGEATVFGMRPLSSAACSAHTVYRWLLENGDRLARPLATCRLLLSPSAAEGELDSAAAPATLEEFARAAHAWRDDASGNRDHVTFFYFAGHGVQRSKEDAVMLLEDFNRPFAGILQYAVDRHNLYWGMSPSESYPEIARTQLYFLDACRDQPEELGELEEAPAAQVFDIELAGQDDRSAPVFLAAVPNARGYALTEGETLFSQALLCCLRSEAAEIDDAGQDGPPRWHVTVHSLTKALPAVLDALNREWGGAQYFQPAGHWYERAICSLSGPPEVPVTLELEPLQASTVARVEVTDGNGGLVHRGGPPLAPHPFSARWQAGFYRFDLRFEPPSPPYQDRSRIRFLKPLSPPFKLRVV